MSIYPKQSRSVDPHDTQRWSSIYNLRSRILTGGQDVILHATSSFAMSYDGDVITIGAGMFVKDDNFVHITEDIDIDITEAIPKYLLDSGVNYISQNDNMTYFFINYQYERTNPPKQARYVAMKDLTPYAQAPSQYIYLGRVVLDSGSIDSINVLDYSASNPLGGTLLLSRPNFTPWCGSTGGNGGVVQGGEWNDDWDE